MNLTNSQRQAIVWLEETPSAGNIVTDEMLRQLASQGIINYEPDSGSVEFTDFGKQVYRELVGTWPKRRG